MPRKGSSTFRIQRSLGVNDQVRKRQKRNSNVAEDGEEHSMILGNVYGCNNGISNIHGKEFPKHS